MAMVALVLFAIAVTGVLTYRNLLGVAVPRSLERLDGHVQLLAAELQAVVRAAAGLRRGANGEWRFRRDCRCLERFRGGRAAPADVAVFGGTDRQVLV